MTHPAAIIWGSAHADASTASALRNPAIILGATDGDAIIWGSAEVDAIISATAAVDGDAIIWGSVLDYP